LIYVNATRRQSAEAFGACLRRQGAQKASSGSGGYSPSIRFLSRKKTLQKRHHPEG
jgi:hypothetical protein